MTKVAILCIFTRPQFTILFIHQLVKLLEEGAIDSIYILDETKYFVKMTQLLGVTVNVIQIPPKLMTIGERRNYLSDIANEDFHVWMDEDDITCPYRVKYQIGEMMRRNIDYSYQKNPLCYDVNTKQLYKNLCGVSASTMAIRKTCKIRFDEVNNHEERPFKMNPKYELDGIVYTLLLNHKNNVSHRISKESADLELLSKFLDDLELSFIKHLT